MNEPGSNPYAPPVAVVNDGDPYQSEGNFIPGGRTVDAGHGASWIGAGWDSFKQSPGAWIVMMILFAVIWIITSLIPLVNLLTIVLFPVLGGGIVIACENQRRNGSLNIGDLFAGFQQKFGPLAILGLIAFGLMLLAMIPIVLIMGVSVFSMFMGGQQPDPAMIATMFGSLGLMFLLIMVASTLMYSALWFAPALIVLHDLSPWDAMKSSFTGCWRNWLGGLIYFILVTLLMIVAMIPLGLGLLIMIPVLWASIYGAYRDIYIED